LAHTLIMEGACACAYSCICHLNIISVSWYIDLIYFLNYISLKQFHGAGKA
jgi:hypothetical protein